MGYTIVQFEFPDGTWKRTPDGRGKYIISPMPMTMKICGFSDSREMIVPRLNIAKSNENDNLVLTVTLEIHHSDTFIQVLDDLTGIVEALNKKDDEEENYGTVQTDNHISKRNDI